MWMQDGVTVADGHGWGNDQLNGPLQVTMDKMNDSLIICDYYNKRIVRLSLRVNRYEETIISNVSCTGLARDEQGYLYVVDQYTHEVRRWKIGETNGVLVAGRNGQGDRFDQLFYPRNLFLDQHNALYIVDHGNHRVMKWEQNAKEGTLLITDSFVSSCSEGLFVDQLNNVYITDSRNHQVICCFKDGKQDSTVIVGGNGEGNQSNKLINPCNLSFDRKGHLYVLDYGNQRVQKFFRQQ